jgi:hypothetical protein
MERQNRPRIIFANLVNDLMVAVPAPRHARSLSAVSPRKIWLARKGDVIITPRAIDATFKSYACALLGVDPDEVVTLSPSTEATELLAHAVMRSGMDQTLRDLAAERPGIELLPFALDTATLQLAEVISVPLAGYCNPPGRTLREAVYRLNTKSGFREVARSLGLAVVPGHSCEGIDALARSVEDLLAHHDGVFIKYDRSSNGYGHIPLRAQDIAGRDLRELLRQRTAAFADQPEVFTVEAWMPFERAPSCELTICEQGAHLLYLCDQRCPNSSFSGMTTPPVDLPAASERQLLHAGEVFGRHVHRLGYRGVCDIDGGITAGGDLYVTETNFRRTGGTYLDALARRLIGDDYLRTHVWWADARPGGGRLGFFAGLDALREAGLAFDRERREGVILTADSSDVDSKWRYLILARGADYAAKMEARISQVLQIEEAPA